MNVVKKEQWGLTEAKVSKSLTYNWTINNYKYLDFQPGPFDSPLFSIGSDEEPKWYLQLYPRDDEEDDDEDNDHDNSNDNDDDDDCLTVCLCHKGDVDYTLKGYWYLSLLDEDKEIFAVEALNLEKCNDYTIDISRKNFNTKINLFANTLTIQCELVKIEKCVNLSSKSEEQVQRQSEVSSVTWGLEKLFLDERLSDVKIEASCGKTLPAHKCLLAARSPVFEAMFVNDMREKSEDEVKIDDGKYEVLKEMLRFIYTGKLENLTANAAELIQLADKYQIMELRNLCEEELNNAISIDNVIDILTIAQQHTIEHLKKRAIIFIKVHHEEIIGSDAFKSLSNVQVLKTVTEAISQK